MTDRYTALEVQGHVSLWHKGTYNRFFPCMEATYHAIITHFTFTDLCCYGRDLGASMVKFHQSEQGISRDLDQ